jgi:threonine aldolase
MSHQKVCLASDNWAPAHPLVLQAIVSANDQCAAAYGTDWWTEEATSLIRETLSSAHARVFMVPTGTGANVLALKLCCARFESIICTDSAHINFQESGALEAIVGAKILTVPHYNGKLTPELILRRLYRERAFAKHGTVPRVVSIAQTTEFGTMYTLSELQDISAVCRQEKLLLHMDGSRIYNAAAALNISLQQIIAAAKVDILSLGGTKNGLMGAEAVVIFNQSLFSGSEHVHKQTLQLTSKMRFVSAQYIPFFKNNLWRELAQHANNKAYELANFIQQSSQFALNYQVETNQIFFTVPEHLINELQEKIFCIPWDLEKNEVRFITSWFTTDKDIIEAKDILSYLDKKYV